MKTITEDGEIIETVTHEVIAMAPPFFKTPFNHDTDHESLSTGLTCKDPSKTQQQFLADADINNILRKFMQTGELEVTGAPTYGDAEELDLQDRMVTRWEVDAAWNKLPAAVRNILKDPKTFTDYIDHCMQTGDIDPLRELGLADPATPAPTAPQATPEPPRPPSPPGGSPAPTAATGAPSAP